MPGGLVFLQIKKINKLKPLFKTAAVCVTRAVFKRVTVLETSELEAP